MPPALRALREHQTHLRDCHRCPHMNGPPVVSNPIVSPVMLIGQAPGTREVAMGKPFAWTAGKTLFGWFADIGLAEGEFRQRVYMAAVCRCFPGKNPGGGDRVPNRTEVANCATWLDAELRLLVPQLLLAVGKLAIAQFMVPDRLDRLVGELFPVTRAGITADLVPLPHPSGASPWHRTEPGRTLLRGALRRVAQHPAWQQVRGAT